MMSGCVQLYERGGLRLSILAMIVILIINSKDTYQCVNVTKAAHLLTPFMSVFIHDAPSDLPSLSLCYSSFFAHDGNA